MHIIGGCVHVTGTVAPRHRFYKRQDSVSRMATRRADGAEIAYGLHQLVTGAMAASAEIRDLTKLNVATNTTSLINRLQTERQNREAGAAPAPAVLGLEDLYEGFAAEDLGGVDEAPL